MCIPKRLICLAIVCSMILSGCGSKGANNLAGEQNEGFSGLGDASAGQYDGFFSVAGDASADIDYPSYVTDVMPSNGSSVQGSISKNTYDSEMFIPQDSDVLVDDGEFLGVIERPFTGVTTTPLSTFAADVDTASYTYLRNTIDLCAKYGNFSEYSDNHEIFMQDVRVEEVLNYFRFDKADEISYKGDKFAYRAEVGTTPWNKDTQILAINVSTPEVPEDLVLKNHFILLIDTSGSMDDVLDDVKESMEVLISSLDNKDSISIVTYAGSYSTLCVNESVGENKHTILNELQRLGSSGSTNGQGGIEKAYEIANEYKDDYDNTRILVLSDGDFNVGQSSHGEVLNLIESNRERGIYLSTFGFGIGNFSDTTMETLADNGNGSYHYIDSRSEAEKIFEEDFTSTMYPLANDVKFQIEFNPNKIKAYRQIGYENRALAPEDFTDATKDGGEIGYNHSVTVVYEIVPVESKMDLPNIDLKYQTTENTGSDDLFTISTSFKKIDSDELTIVDESFGSEIVLDDNSAFWKFCTGVTGSVLRLNGSEYVKKFDLADAIDLISESEDVVTKEKYADEYTTLLKRIQEMYGIH